MSIGLDLSIDNGKNPDTEILGNASGGNAVATGKANSMESSEEMSSVSPTEEQNRVVEEGRRSPPLTTVVSINDQNALHESTEDVDGQSKSRIPTLVKRRTGASPCSLTKRPTPPPPPACKQHSAIKRRAQTPTNKPSNVPPAVVPEGGFVPAQQYQFLNNYNCPDSPPPSLDTSASPKIRRAGRTARSTQDNRITSPPTDFPTPSPTESCHDSSPQVSMGEPTAELKAMSDHPSYHSNVTGKQAEDILKKHGGACYLTRHSKSNNCYVLSVLQTASRKGAKIGHFVLKINKRSLYEHIVTSEIEGTCLAFEDIFKLLQFYEQNPVDHEFRNIGTMITSDDYKGKCHVGICSYASSWHTIPNPNP